MNFREQPLMFDCLGERLFGVLAIPEVLHRTAVLIIVGGPQYRAGSHRQFVLLARALAAQGHAVLRFDYRGMGDSGGASRTFESVSDDIASAVDALQAAVPTAEQVVLWGLCDGASAALLYLHERRDARIGGLCLLNPWVRSEVGLARAHVKHYYGRRVLQREFWLKLASGKVGADALRGLARNLGQAMRGCAASRARSKASTSDRTYQQDMATAWQQFRKPILLVLSGNDLTAREFQDFVASEPAWRGALALPSVKRKDLLDADHTFSGRTARNKVEALTLSWLQDCATNVPES